MMLAELTLSDNQTGLAALGFFVLMASSYFVVQKFIRDQIGHKDTTQVELKPNNEVTVKTKVEFVPVPEFEKFCEYVHKTNHDLNGQLNSITLAATDRQEQAATDRAELLHEIHITRNIITNSSAEITRVSTGMVTKTHDRINSVERTMGEVTGELKKVGELVMQLIGRLK